MGAMDEEKQAAVIEWQNKYIATWKDLFPEHFSAELVDRIVHIKDPMGDINYANDVNAPSSSSSSSS